MSGTRLPLPSSWSFPEKYLEFRGLIFLLILLAYLRLIFQVFADFSSGKVPDFDETINGSGHKVLSIRRKCGAFDVRFGAKFDLLAQHRRELLLLLLPHCGLTPEQVDLGTCNGNKGISGHVSVEKKFMTNQAKSPAASIHYIIFLFLFG